MQTLKSLLVALLLGLVVLMPCTADKRTENIDIILAIDKSLSMGESQAIESVKSYAKSWLLDQVLIPGDYLVIIAFYGKTDVIVSQVINSSTDIQYVKGIVSQIRGNGYYTDIGNAFDAMRTEFDKLANDGRKKFVLMMTDGKQEAPPSSKYYSPDGTFNHEFLANTKTIQQAGWKVEIIGIGTGTEVKELAEQLSGTYSEIPGSVTPETLQAQTENLLGRVTLEGGVKVAAVNINGRSRLYFTLTSEGYDREVTITISKIMATPPSGEQVQILPSPFPIKVSASGTTGISVPVSFPSDLEPGKTTSTLSFSFLSGERFDPSEVQVSLNVKGMVGSYWWVGVITLAVLAALVIFSILLVRRLTVAKPKAFILLIDGTPLSAKPFTLAPNRESFLFEVSGKYEVIPRRNARSLLRFRIKGGKLGFDILKSERFAKISGWIDDVVGKSFAMRAENGQPIQLTVADPAHTRAVTLASAQKPARAPTPERAKITETAAKSRGALKRTAKPGMKKRKPSPAKKTVGRAPSVKRKAARRTPRKR
jgi:hypothetical protein